MAYCTLTDIKAVIAEETIIQLTDEDGLGVIDQTKVDKAITDADAEIDAYCGLKYTVPFSTVPAVIAKCSVDIAIYNLYSLSPAEEAPEIRTQRYNNAIKLLTSVTKGLISLGVDPAPPATSQGGPATNKTESDRIFTRDSLKNY